MCLLAKRPDDLRSAQRLAVIVEERRIARFFQVLLKLVNPRRVLRRADDENSILRRHMLPMLESGLGERVKMAWLQPCFGGFGALHELVAERLDAEPHGLDGCRPQCLSIEIRQKPCYRML